MKAALLAMLFSVLPCLADNLVLVDGTVTQRYYPNPNLKLITHLVITTNDSSYLLS